MINIHDGQCGTCSHFGADVPEQQLVQIRVNRQAEPDVVGGCGLPGNARVHLKVSAVSSCDQYEAAA